MLSILFLEDLNQKLPLPDALAQPSSCLLPIAQVLAPELSKDPDLLESYVSQFLVWNLCLPGGRVGEPVNPLGSPTSTKLSATHILDPLNEALKNCFDSFLACFRFLQVIALSWKKKN